MQILKGKSPIEDFNKLINALDIKFKFKDRFKFEKELLDLVASIKTTGINDSDEFGDKFFNLIKDNSSEPGLDKNISKATEEIESISRKLKNG
jgi:hypothetical protein